MVLGPLRFTNANGGTADFVYPGPAIDMQSPASARAVDGTTYLIYSQSLDMSQWEIATGAYTASSKTFARTTVTANSLGTTAKINFGNPPQVVVYDPITIPAPTVEIPSGSAMLFQQTAAPTGWTKVVTYNDCGLRVVNGTAGSGGANAFSTVMAQTVVGSHTLSVSEIPSHGHSVSDTHTHGYSEPTFPGGGSPFASGGGISISSSSLSTSGTNSGAISVLANGGGSAHNHSIVMNMTYVDIIIATKN
jgi:hypothetical protein